MPEKKWVFDTVVLSNFLLSDAIFVLENRYAGTAVGVLSKSGMGSTFREVAAGYCDMCHKHRDMPNNAYSSVIDAK